MTSDPAILVDGLTKDYTYFEKEEGLRGSLRALFARKKPDPPGGGRFLLYPRKRRDRRADGAKRGGENHADQDAGRHPPAHRRAARRCWVMIRRRPTDAYKKQFALVMGQKSQLWWDLPAADTFLLNQAIYEIPEADLPPQPGAATRRCSTSASC